jgi:fumarylpyruvate hydrolase
LTQTVVSEHPSAGRIWLSVNGDIKQDANLSEMIRSVPEIIAALSSSWVLQPGDLIFTGTPAGVGPLRPGDRVECGVASLTPLSFTIKQRQ